MRIDTIYQCLPAVFAWASVFIKKKDLERVENPNILDQIEKFFVFLIFSLSKQILNTPNHSQKVPTYPV